MTGLVCRRERCKRSSRKPGLEEDSSQSHATGLTTSPGEISQNRMATVFECCDETLENRPDWPIRAASDRLPPHRCPAGRVTNVLRTSLLIVRPFKRLCDRLLPTPERHRCLKIQLRDVHAGFLRLNLFTYRELTNWLHNRMETPPLIPAAEQLILALT